MQTTKSKQKVLTRVSSTWKLAERNVNHYVIIIINSWRQFHAANCLNLVNFVSQYVQKEKRYGQIEDTSETKRTAALTNISNDASLNEQTLTKRISSRCNLSLS